MLGQWPEVGGGDRISIRARDRGVLIHDELSPVSGPFYLLEVVQQVRAAGLRYICGINLMDDWIEVNPRQVKRAFSAAGMSRRQALQYGDFLFARTFRRSIFRDRAG